ncbi:MAG TPA: hypothetical protein VFJ51_06100 [Nitrososphaeraceae archaeon]|nr:hypothetical protein [Nitrososphaeraceae archaeon]
MKKREIVIDTEGKSIKEFNGLPNTQDNNDDNNHHYYLQQSHQINGQSQNVDTLDFEFSL